MKSKAFLVSLFGSVSLFLFFQNCSNSKFSSVDSSSLLDSSSITGGSQSLTGTGDVSSTQDPKNLPTPDPKNAPNDCKSTSYAYMVDSFSCQGAVPMLKHLATYELKVSSNPTYGVARLVCKNGELFYADGEKPVCSNDPSVLSMSNQNAFFTKSLYTIDMDKFAELNTSAKNEDEIYLCVTPVVSQYIRCLKDDDYKLIPRPALTAQNRKQALIYKTPNFTDMLGFELFTQYSFRMKKKDAAGKLNYFSTAYLEVGVFKPTELGYRSFGNAYVGNYFETLCWDHRKVVEPVPSLDHGWKNFSKSFVDYGNGQSAGCRYRSSFEYCKSHSDSSGLCTIGQR